MCAWYDPRTWGAWYDPRTWGKKEEVKVEVTEPEVHGIMITDTTAGESVKTETVGGEVVKRTYRGGGGGGRGRAVISAVEKAQEESAIMEPTPTPELPTAKTLTPTPELPTAKTLTPTPHAVMSAYHPEDFKQYLKLSPWEATKHSLGQIGTTIGATFPLGALFGGKVEQKEDVGYEHWFDIFGHVGKRKEEKVAYYEPKFGTSVLGESGEVTYGDIQLKAEEKRLLETTPIIVKHGEEMKEYGVGLQEEIYTGGITVPEAEKLYEEKLELIQPEYEKEMLGVYEKYPDVSGLYEQTGAVVPKVATWGFETATMFSPLTSFMMAAHKSRLTGEHGVGYGKIVTEGVSEHEASLFAGAGAIGVIRMPFKIGKEITALRWEEGLKAKSLTMPREIYTRGKETFYMTRTFKQTPYFKASTKMQYPIFTTESGYQIGAGTGKTTVRFLPFMEQIGTEGWVSAAKSFSLGGGKITPSLIKGFTEKGFRGKAFVVGEGKTGIERIDFAGWTKDFDKAIVGRGGGITKARYYPTTGKLTGLFEPKDYMIMKKGLGLDLTSKEGFKGWTSFGGGGTKSSSAYLQSLYQTKQIPVTFGGAVQGATVKFAAPSIKQAPKVYPLLVGGVGGLKTASVYDTSLVQKQRGFISPLVFGGQEFKQKLAGGSAVSPALLSPQAIIPKQFTVPVYKQAQVQEFKQPQKFAPFVSTPSIKPLAPFVPSTIPFVPAIPLWFPPRGMGKAMGGRMIQPEQILGYTPSFAGFTWGIKAPKIPVPRFGKFTGLEIRPIVGEQLIKLKL